MMNVANLHGEVANIRDGEMANQGSGSYPDTSIEAPLSKKPAKKYSDISGLEAPYTDPLSRLRFSTPEEFSVIQGLPPNIITGYLSLRKALAPV
ncbi:unnamed protein product [Cyprideis torosa]|uniref:Uncharacterized protein n=1 Tax=Cyprideis torosa TaxID=163714 RepID=A0A7R8ZJM2_9CRUS|nr:unnamed protein product [Cyprideis torosa]CAG0882611.1 unnamed protein product [Cyprideis torosa]